jgi:NAD(P)-dependent dehydrogenase (short-subunit alcohol dehydrogenase family)
MDRPARNSSRRPGQQRWGFSLHAGIFRRDDFGGDGQHLASCELSRADDAVDTIPPLASVRLMILTSPYRQNIHATLLLTRLTLPYLLTKKSTPGPKVKSLILNIGSFGGTVPSPLLATYSASKAFLATWNKALGEEVKKDGVVVRLVLPGFVVSPAPS